jgi:hypothetical protein
MYLTNNSLFKDLHLFIKTMQITDSQEFNTQAGSIGTRHTLKNENSKNELKNILIKLCNVTISPLEGKKLAIKVDDEATLNVLNQFEEKLSNFLISHFNTSNECISPVVYTSDSGNNTVYVRLNNYSSFYDVTGEDYELENRRVIGDCIIKFDTVTYVNGKYYVNGSLYQCLVKDVAPNSKILLNFDSEFMNNF